ncbi:MAG: hypothetical protein HY577_01635 [Candidatus Nealsonbacteria bacterium]|nr:hypothetical protein [Candidatus Nealsonbacteria bacterium]
MFIHRLKNPQIYLVIFLFLLLLSWYGLFLIHRIDLAAADLGRHLKNGQILLENFSLDSPVLKTNFYSYTEPDYQTINHHWLSGVIFFLVFQFFGFVGLHLFFVLLSFFAFWLFFRIARQEAGLGPAVVLSLLIIPLVAERIEIRPEVFSYVLAGIFFNLLWTWRRQSERSSWLLVLPLLEVLWVNLHIYFILGPILIGVFLFESLTISERRRFFPKLGLIFLLVVLASLINPFGPKGSFDPLTIFQNYGYRLLENQSVWFLEKLGFIINPNFLLFKIVLVVLILSFLAVLKMAPRRVSLANLILASGLALAGFLAIRNFTVFGFFSLPLIAANLKVIKEKNPFPERIQLDFLSLSFRSLAVALGLTLVVLLVFNHSPRIAVPPLGLDVLAGNASAADFFQKQGLKGPIFNNYDIGGYLIFYLFPRERVFVDNRPEAYSAAFFQKEYIPFQEDENEWRRGEEKYGFNAIFFSHRDATPWGQEFLARRIRDPNWAPVFVDNYNIIFLKRNELNQGVIDRYEIPQIYFRITE